MRHIENDDHSYHGRVQFRLNITRVAQEDCLVIQLVRHNSSLWRKCHLAEVMLVLFQFQDYYVVYPTQYTSRMGTPRMKQEVGADTSVIKIE